MTLGLLPIHRPQSLAQNQGVAPTNETVLDRDQFRAITLEDEDLMREILGALIEDTSSQIERIKTAIESADREQTRRLAHYSKGACANVGAKAAAAILQRLEHEALEGQFEACTSSLLALAGQLELLRGEAQSI